MTRERGAATGWLPQAGAATARALQVTRERAATFWLPQAGGAAAGALRVISSGSAAAAMYWSEAGQAP